MPHKVIRNMVSKAKDKLKAGLIAIKVLSTNNFQSFQVVDRQHLDELMKF
jgi:hypothetical protein